jgi:hypothetical protein
VGTGGRKKTVPVKVAPGDKFGKWRAMFVHRGQELLQVAPLGPNVQASNPDALQERTDESLVDRTEEDPN